MNTEFDNDIVQIITKINSLNESFNISDNSPEHTKDQVKKRVSTGGNYALQQHQWKQGYLNYKREIRRNPDGNVMNFDVVESKEDLINIINQNEYKKSWGRLDKFQQRKKINEYVKNLVNKELLDNIYEKVLIKQLEELINTNKIIKTAHVKYNSENCEIDTIKCLDLFENKTYKIK